MYMYVFISVRVCLIMCMYMTVGLYVKILACTHIQSIPIQTTLIKLLYSNGRKNHDKSSSSQRLSSGCQFSMIDVLPPPYGAVESNSISMACRRHCFYDACQLCVLSYYSHRPAISIVPQSINIHVHIIVAHIYYITLYMLNMFIHNNMMIRK